MYQPQQQHEHYDTKSATSSSEGEVYSGPIAQANAEVRRGFVRKVYGVLASQLGLTAVIMAIMMHSFDKTWAVNHRWLLFTALAGSLVTVCAASCCIQTMRTFPQNYMILGAFTFFESIVLGFVSLTYTLPSVLLAATATAVTFGGLTMYACTTKSDFTGMGPYLYAALCSLIGISFTISLVSFFTGIPHWVAIMQATIGVLIFSFYIIYDTQLLLGGSRENSIGVDDYVLAALNLYLDVINLFLYFLELFGSRE